MIELLKQQLRTWDTRLTLSWKNYAILVFRVAPQPPWSDSHVFYVLRYETSNGVMLTSCVGLSKHHAICSLQWRHNRLCNQLSVQGPTSTGGPLADMNNFQEWAVQGFAQGPKQPIYTIGFLSYSWLSHLNDNAEPNLKSSLRANSIDFIWHHGH